MSAQAEEASANVDVSIDNATVNNPMSSQDSTDTDTMSNLMRVNYMAQIISLAESVR